MANFTDFLDGSRLAAGGLKDFATGLVSPTVRLGITGLSRSGKTVFITALVHALLNRASLPLFEAHARGRITRAYLEPQPDDELPRFAYESHITKLTGKTPEWPESTTRMSQLRLTVDYEPQGFLARNLQSGKLHIDLIDYPGEWLLDLPLLRMSYQQWSTQTVAASRLEPRKTAAAGWHALLDQVAPHSPADESHAINSAQAFTAYLAKCRTDALQLSALPPGRFLMPGDLAGSPLLTFAPLDIAADADIQPGTLASLMARRYESYVSRVVKPFFYGHFARLDRQIVLVDVLSTLNAGAAAVNDLRQALGDVLMSFRTGSNTILTELFGRKIDRILFAATKADQLHHSNHDRLESILRVLIEEAKSSAEYQGADTHIAALAAIRATREAHLKLKREELSAIVGIPKQAEEIDGTTFDGQKEAAIFPGDLPENPEHALDGSMEGKLKFVRFVPPVAANAQFPYIRLDRAIEFLLGDKFA